MSKVIATTDLDWIIGGKCCTASLSPPGASTYMHLVISQVALQQGGLLRDVCHQCLEHTAVQYAAHSSERRRPWLLSGAALN